MTFALTKIQPPRPRAALVERDALQARLARALTSQRVVLLCAPAGYGKTTLLAQQIARLPPTVAVAWISADAGDDLHRLLECMITALEPFDPAWRTAPEKLAERFMDSPAGQTETIAQMVNALDACDVAHGVVVFDDLHRIDDPAFFRFIDHLIERLGSRWTMVLSTRHDPPLSLSRLRASGELAEFRQLHLQFAHDEARRLAHTAGLDDALADRLFTRTHGWPAGLRIAMGAVAGGTEAHGTAVSTERALRASEPPLFEFLVAEVLDQLEPGLAAFLERVAVLPELDADRCAIVARDPDAAARLDAIERLGLFVDVLDAPVPTLRLHDLFREALIRSLGQRDPEALATARRLAVETEGDPIRRITLLLDAGDLAPAAALVYAHVPSMVARSGPATAMNLIGRFPAHARERLPELQFVRGLVAWVHWDFPEMLAMFQRAEAGFAARRQQEDELLARAFRATGLIPMGRLDESAELVRSLRGLDLPAAAQVMRLHAESWLAVDDGRTHEVAPLVVEMLDLLERVDRLDLWYHTTPANRLPGLPGMTRPLLRHAALMVRLSDDEPSTLRALAFLVQAWDALWQGRFAEADAITERARDDAAWAGRTGAVRGHLLALTALREATRGRTGPAVDAAETRLRELGARHSDWGRWVLLQFVARTAAACGDIQALRDALRRADAQLLLVGATANPARIRSIVPLRGQLAWLEDRTDDAVKAWREALDHEAEIEVWGLAPETRVRLARALLRRRDLAGAAAVLSPVFERAEREQGAGGALLAGDALAELAAARWGRSLPARLRGSLEGWSRMLAAERAQGVRAAAEIAAPSSRDHWLGLTLREREVLERIAAGDSNKLIARRLDLSPHTVKRHVANILDKLEVETRGQAAAWHRDRAR